MKVILTLSLLLSTMMLFGVSIFQIQFTTDSGGDNTYPSYFAGKTVTVEGIVTATGFKSGGFFMSESAGGPWRGIYVRSATASVSPGDKIVLKGKVAEYFGMTCLQDIDRISVLDTHHSIPFANQVTTGQITTPEQAESFEGTLVKIQNASFIQTASGSLRLTVNDGSGSCNICDNLTSDKIAKYKPGEIFNALTGIVCYAFGEYSVNPRSRNDVSIMVPVFNQNRSWGRIKSIYK
jgi:hypothetical protein